MPALPTQVRESIPAKNDTTLVEVSCRLVGKRSAEATGMANLSLLVCPSIQVSLEAVESALAQHLPAMEVAGQPAGARQDGAAAARDAGQVPGWPSLALQLLQSGSRAILSWLPGPWQALSHQLPPPQLLAWHTQRPVLAIGHSGSGSVLLYEAGEAAAAAAAPAARDVVGVLTRPQQVLTHQLQQQVSGLAWRPVHGSMLAVGCLGGVALWSLGKLPLSAAAVLRANGRCGGGGGSSQQGGWVTFLEFKAGCRVTSLTWSPDGTKLAGSSSDTNRIMVWDAALGVGAKLRLGLVPVHLLSWSPDGNYLFAADRAGAFFLYETSSWSVKRWDSPPGAAVTGAAWAPDSSVLLLSLAGSNVLIGLHIVGSTPTSLTEQMLPVTLPGVSDVELPKQCKGDAAAGQQLSCISSIAWDPTGNRLAVVLAAPHPAAGTVALFSTTFAPVVQSSLLGFVQPGGLAVAGDAADTGEQEAGTHSSATAGLQVAFAPTPPGKAKCAGLLSVGLPSSGSHGTGAIVNVLNVPMYY